jgi:hypothetical protein
MNETTPLMTRDRHIQYVFMPIISLVVEQLIAGIGYLGVRI